MRHDNFFEKIKNPTMMLEALLHTKWGWILPDDKAISMLYKQRFGKNIDLNNPKSFNEKLLWLTLHDRNPQYNIMVDKYLAKEWISSIIGDGYTAKTIQIYNSSKEIDFEKLPSKFVLKCNHDSGSVVVCNNIRPTQEQIRFLDHNLRKNYFWFSREWYYKDVKALIFAEEYIDSPSDNQGGLVDYKVYCFHGIPHMICVISNRSTKPNLTFFDLDWNPISVKQRYENHKILPNKPQSFNEMLKLAQKLSKDIPFLRVDFFEDVNHRLLVGELTFVPSSALIPFDPESFDYELGEKINLEMVSSTKIHRIREDNENFLH